jgi:hypothetical protein
MAWFPAPRVADVTNVVVVTDKPMSYRYIDTMLYVVGALLVGVIARKRSTARQRRRLTAGVPMVVIHLGGRT